MKTLKVFVIALMASLAIFTSKQAKAQITPDTRAKVNITLSNIPQSPTNPQTAWDGTAYVYLVNAGITVPQIIHVPMTVSSYPFYVKIPMSTYTGEIQITINLGYGGRIYWIGKAKAVGTWSYLFEHTPIIVNTWLPN